MALLVPLAHVATPSATVYLMRHCVRATYYPDLYHWDWPYLYLSNYSDGGALPDWGVAPTLCTKRGRQLVVGEGSALKAEMAQRTCGKPLKVIFDSGSQRDNTTAEDLLTGLGMDPSIRVGDAEIFEPAATTGCPKVSAADRAAGVRAQLNSVPALTDLPARLAALQAVLGPGVAPPLSSIPDMVSADGYYDGGLFAAASWVEAMLLQFGSGLPVAYGRVNASYLYELLELNVYYRALNDRPMVVERRGGSNLLSHMMDDLASAEGGASVYVGHDTNLDEIAVLLDLAWESAAPYPANTTAPGSLLRLTRTGDEVTADFLYTTFETADGALTTAPVALAGAPSMTLAALQAKATQRIDPKCVLKAASSAQGRAQDAPLAHGVLERPPPEAPPVEAAAPEDAAQGDAAPPPPCPRFNDPYCEIDTRVESRECPPCFTACDPPVNPYSPISYCYSKSGHKACGTYVHDWDDYPRCHKKASHSKPGLVEEVVSAQE